MLFCYRLRPMLVFVWRLYDHTQLEGVEVENVFVFRNLQNVLLIGDVSWICRVCKCYDAPELRVSWLFRSSIHNRLENLFLMLATLILKQNFVKERMFYQHEHKSFLLHGHLRLLIINCVTKVCLHLVIIWFKSSKDFFD